MTWDNTFFGECAELIKDTVQPSDVLGLPYIGLEHISQGQLSLLGFGKSDDVISAKSRFRKGDILFGKLRPYFRKVIIAPFDGVCSTDIWVVRAKQNIDQKFLFYRMASEDFVETSSRASEGTKMPRAQWEFVERIQQQIPSTPEQRAIAGILGGLDDKIELNRHMNVTLESMARAVFRQWFVENEEAKYWDEIEVGKFADVIDCMHTKKPDRQSEGKPLIQLWNILDNGLLDMKDTYFISEERYKHWVSRIEASPGDCIITNTGRVAATAQIPEGYKAALGRNMTGIRCKKEYPYPTFLIECLSSDAMRQEIDRKTDVGTILDSLNVRNIPTLRFRLPNHKLLGKYEDLARPIRAMMEKNLAQSRTLASLRDGLLPKVMRGEVRVKEGQNEFLF